MRKLKVNHSVMGRKMYRSLVNNEFSNSGLRGGETRTRLSRMRILVIIVSNVHVYQVKKFSEES